MSHHPVTAKIIRLPMYMAKIEEGKFDLKLIETDERFVSTGIEKSYKFWENYDPNIPIMITAPTGCGKNFFIENTLIPYLSKKYYAKEKKLLIVCNRSPLNRQLKSRVIKTLGFTDVYNIDAKRFDELENFGPVTLCTYQHLSKIVLKKEDWSSFRFVVFDECHFFASDAVFNPQTAKLLNILPTIFSDAVRIYLSATSEEVAEEIYTQEILAREKEISEAPEKKTGRELHSQLINFGNRFSHPQFTPIPMQSEPIITPYHYPMQPEPIITLYHYRFRADYSNLVFHYFEKRDEYTDLINYIRQSPKNDKWLIFVSSKKIGKSLENSIGKDSVFLSSESKSSKENDGTAYQSLIKNESFEQKVLIATSVLNNGININDDALKHIVILVYDRVEAIQMIGRKRRKENEKVHIYLQAPDTETISHLISRNNDKIKMCDTCAYAFSENGNYLDREYFYEANFTEKNNWETAHVLLGYDGKRQRFYYNELAYKKIQRTLEVLNLTKERIEQEGRSASIKIQLSWFGCEDLYDESNWIHFEQDTEDKNKLYELFDRNSDAVMQMNDRKQFLNELEKILKLPYFSDKISGDIRRKRNLENVRGVIQQLKLPYEIIAGEQNGKATWIIKKK